MIPEIHHRPLLAFLVLLLGLAAAGSAARRFEVWVQGRVVDQDGEPLEGVEITVTREGSDSEIRDETNRRGHYRVLLFRGHREHTIRLDLPGYQSLTQPIPALEASSWDDREKSRARPEGNALELDFTMRSLESIEEGAAESPEDASPEARRRAATPIYNQGVYAAQSMLWVRAEERFRAALEIDPEMGPAWAGLAKVLYERRRCEESLEAGERARELVPRDLELLEIRIECLRRTGETEAMREAVDELAEKDPYRAAPSLMERAHLLYEARDSEAALSVLEGLVEAIPDHAGAHHLLGLVLLGLDRTEAAREALERYLELAPEAEDAEDVRALLAEL